MFSKRSYCLAASAASAILILGFATLPSKANPVDPPSIPLIDVTIPSGTTGTMDYVIFFADVNSTGEWFETPVQVDTVTPPQITVTDTSAVAETLSNVGYQLSPTLIPLDQLNAMDYPPPGSPGSSFTPMPSYDTPLNPGSSVLPQGNSEAGSPVTLETTPLPATWTMMLIGLAGLGFVAYRRQRQDAGLAGA